MLNWINFINFSSGTWTWKKGDVNGNYFVQTIPVKLLHLLCLMNSIYKWWWMSYKIFKCWWTRW